jgi:hypothetical protein
MTQSFFNITIRKKTFFFVFENNQKKSLLISSKNSNINDVDQQRFGDEDFFSVSSRLCHCVKRHIWLIVLLNA